MADGQPVQKSDNPEMVDAKICRKAREVGDKFRALAEAELSTLGSDTEPSGKLKLEPLQNQDEVH